MINFHSEVHLLSSGFAIFSASSTFTFAEKESEKECKKSTLTFESHSPSSKLANSFEFPFLNRNQIQIVNYLLDDEYDLMLLLNGWMMWTFLIIHYHRLRRNQFSSEYFFFSFCPLFHCDEIEWLLWGSELCRTASSFFIIYFVFLPLFLFLFVADKKKHDVCERWPNC